MYIDGFLAAVTTTSRDAYVEFASKMDPLFIEYGATRVVDGWGSDVPRGERTDFYRAVAATEDETPVFGWIEWPDKATRDAGWDKMMKDERMAGHKQPFDGKRMVFGAFDAIVVEEK